MTDPTISELRELLGKATEGPWKIANWGYEHEPHMIIEGPDKPKPATHGDMYWFGGQKAVDWGDDWNADNAALIVAMRNALPGLLDRLEMTEATAAAWYSEPAGGQS